MPATVRGIAAATTVAPGTLAEASEILAAAAGAGRTVAFLGGGTEIGLGYAPRSIDLLVRTERLARIVEYQPADMVVEVECGLTLAALQAALAPSGQRLALDAPQPERATLGGLVATNAFGPRRARFGSLRDLIVGVSFLRADGSRARGGGKVVKNVAGFDLPKLAVGSLGSLAMIATATFRLHPLPETTLAVRVPERSAAEVAALVRELFAAQLEPAAVLAFRANGRYTVHVVFEGFASGAHEQRDRCARIARSQGAQAIEADADDAATLDDAVRTHGDLRVRIAVPPADLANLDAAALGALERGLTDPKLVAYPTLGIVFASGFANGTTSDALLAARGAAEAMGGNAVLLEAPDAVAAHVDVYGALPPSFALMRGLKDRFDPTHRLNPGRFLGKL